MGSWEASPPSHRWLFDRTLLLSQLRRASLVHLFSLLASRCLRTTQITWPIPTSVSHSADPLASFKPSVKPRTPQSLSLGPRKKYQQSHFNACSCACLENIPFCLHWLCALRPARPGPARQSCLSIFSLAKPKSPPIFPKLCMPAELSQYPRTPQPDTTPRFFVA